MTRLDVFGDPVELSVPNTVICDTCSATAERCSTAAQGHGVIYHNYRCRTCRDAGRIDGGTIVEREGSISRRVGPVFQRPYNQIDVDGSITESRSTAKNTTSIDTNTDTDTDTSTGTETDNNADDEPRTPIQPP